MLQYDQPTQAMIYLVNKHNNFFALDNENGLDNVNSSNNEDAMSLRAGYVLKTKLYNLCKTRFDCLVEDLGVTILLINFAQFFSRNQYVLFSNFFKHIEEIKHLEIFLTGNHVKNMKYYDLGIHHVYGILAQKERFTSKQIMTYIDFLCFLPRLPTAHFHDKEKTVEYFSNFHIRIVESLYNLTSIPDVKAIKESNKIGRRMLMYKFPEVVKTSIFDADYWFVLPSKVVWFAYFKRQYYFTGYVEVSLDEQFRKFDDFDYIVIGYISKHQIFPLYFDCKPFWHQSMEMFRQHNIVTHMVSKNIDSKTKKNLYFVKEGDFNVYKFLG